MKPILFSNRSCKLAQVWWHLPLVALGLAAIAVAAGLLFVWLRSRNAKRIATILEEVRGGLWDTWTAMLAEKTPKQ